MESVYCAVRTQSLYMTDMFHSLKVKHAYFTMSASRLDPKYLLCLKKGEDKESM